MRKTLSIGLILSLLLLPSCVTADTDSFDAGKPITKDELASISAELFTAANEPSDTADGNVNRDPNHVYWVKGGSVYHFDPNCQHIQNSDSVIEGTFRTAQWSYGIERPCSTCGKAS